MTDPQDIARQRIAEEAKARTGTLKLSSIRGLEKLPDEIATLGHLQTLDCSLTQVSDLAPLKDLDTLQSLHCSGTHVSDLAPLKDLDTLQTLYCSRTHVSDLAPLKNLDALQYLHCSRTQVSDLAPLKNLDALQNLHCFNTHVSDLAPLKDLDALQSLHCSGTHVSDLAPLKDLDALQSLNCSLTHVSDLAPLKDLDALQNLNCSYTHVSDLAPLKDLDALQNLDCSLTHVSDLAPLKDLDALQTLDCSRTQVSDLTPLKDLDALQTLYCSLRRIERFPERLWRSGSLQKVVAHQAEIAGLPDEILSKSVIDNCLPAVRAHLDDLGEQPETLSDVKLMILGNGRIGKTQIKNRLRGEPFEEEADSTHGITVSDAKIPGTSDRFNIWDFGGQDIYFGTHMLFLKSRAVFMLVWTPESDDSATHEHHGMTFRNQPVAWWLDCIRRFGSEKSPLIVVQNQLDLDQNRGEHTALAGVRDDLNVCGSVAYSACTDEGRGALEGHLKDAAQRFNPPLIGRGRLDVMRKLQAWLAEDEKREAEDKQHRLLAFDDFVALCERTGQVSNPTQFLKFLHNAGIVFWREGLFHNQVILDQGWVLEAIYTVFHRDHCLETLRRRRGRFTRADLAMMIWNREGYSRDEQELFLSFMLSSGICFKLRPKTDAFEAEYIVPDHLPEAWDADDRAERWGEAKADPDRTVDYPSLPPALMRNLIGQIGGRARLKADYWRNGFYGFERETRSKILVEQTHTEGWEGRIHIQAQGAQANRLVEMMADLLREEEQKLGLVSNEAERPVMESDKKSDVARPLDFDHEPSDKKNYFISYAWADDKTEAGRQRAEIVDIFCARAKEQGIAVQRDKDVMRLGDSIGKFMDRLARGDRVIVVLSDKYLRSPFCMYELYEIWRLAGSDKEMFRERIRAFRLKDAVIAMPYDRVKYAIYWKTEYEKYEPIVKEHGFDVFGAEDAQKVIHMSRFRMHIGDILAAVADILQPSNVEELIAYSFDDDPDDDRRVAS